ncbi:MAG: D-glycero-beta-D-manno-heptose 1,7-bisphosphate 7-phosphatase [Actinomycetota bacterium]
MQSVPRRAIFLDRDGVICNNREDYVKSWDELSFIPGSIDAVVSLSRAGYPIFIVTNQSAVGRGVITREQLDEIHALLLNTLEAQGARIEEILVCPHAPSDECDCRKPAPGLLIAAAQKHGLDLSGSYLVGDAESDVEAAAAAGCGAVLVLSGRGAAQAREKTWSKATPEFVAHDLVDASIWILARMAVAKNARSFSGEALRGME